MENLYNSVAQLGKLYSAGKVVLFGSRARGDNTEKSDIDLAVYGMDKGKQISFAEAVNELPTLLKFDIIFVDNKTNRVLLDNINRDGVIIMNKLNEKLTKFKRATKRLEEALAEYEEYAVSSCRDGVIQRFEFCTELAWKSTREYLIEEGYVELDSPRSVMRQAYSSGLITDEQAWLDLLFSRNKTSHIYDEATADDIFKSIKDKYLVLFKELAERLDK